MDLVRFPQQVVPVAPIVYDRGNLRLDKQVQDGLNLFLDLKNRAQMPALLDMLDGRKPEIQDALRSLHYVHFARFLPSRDGASLMVITVYDGDLKSYIMDFVAVLGEVFTAVLHYIKDAPRLPVKKYPDDFWEFVQRNNLDRVNPWSAYPETTVIEIQKNRALR